jgi:hypothetical protein
MVLRRKFITFTAFDTKKNNVFDKATDEAIETATRDTDFLTLMKNHSYLDIHEAFTQINWFLVDVNVLITGQPPIDSRTQTPVQTITLSYLHYMISNNILTSNGEIIPRLFCKLVLNYEVLTWSTIGKSIVNYYKSNNITHNMLSNTPNDFIKPMVQLVFGIADYTTKIDTSHIHTLDNYNAMLNFNVCCCIRWTKHPEYCWYIDPKTLIIKPNIDVGIDDFYYCDSIDQFIVID